MKNDNSVLLSAIASVALLCSLFLSWVEFDNGSVMRGISIRIACLGILVEAWFPIVLALFGTALTVAVRRGKLSISSLVPASLALAAGIFIVRALWVIGGSTNTSLCLGPLVAFAGVICSLAASHLTEAEDPRPDLAGRESME